MIDKYNTLKPILLGADGKPMVQNHRVVMHHKGKDGLVWQSYVVMWDAWTEPYGYLPRDREAQALMSYCIEVSRVRDQVVDCPTLVGEPSRFIPARSLLLLYCSMYNVEPEKAVKFWPCIEKQRQLLGLSKEADLPNHLKYPLWDNYGHA